MTDWDHWNYRVLRRYDGEDAATFQIIEAYYNTRGRIVAWHEETSPVGYDIADLGAGIALMMRALALTTLTLEDLPGEPTDPEEILEHATKADPLLCVAHTWRPDDNSCVTCGAVRGFMAT